MKEDAKIYEIEIGGRKVTFETGKLCEQANGSCLVRCGESVRKPYLYITSTSSAPVYY